eukprot:scaffold90652_cov63-Phaeocystis_antarctica.AAC.2
MSSVSESLRQETGAILADVSPQVQGTTRRRPGRTEAQRRGRAWDSRGRAELTFAPARPPGAT